MNKIIDHYAIRDYKFKFQVGNKKPEFFIGSEESLLHDHPSAIILSKEKLNNKN